MIQKQFFRVFQLFAPEADPRQGGNAPGRHFWWEEEIANGLSRMNLKLDLGFTFWLRLNLPYVRFGRDCPGISLQWNFQN